jgi:hypothetical protein
MPEDINTTWARGLSNDHIAEVIESLALGIPDGRRAALYVEAARRLRTDEAEYVTKTGKVLTESDIYDLAQEAEEGYDIPLCGHRWYEMPQPGEEPNAGPEHPNFVVRTCTLGKNHRKPVDHHDKNAPNA